MFDVTATFLEINPPTSCEAVVLRALNSEHSKPKAVALWSMAQFHALMEHIEEAESIFKTAIHVAIAVEGAEGKLVRQIKKAFEQFELQVETGTLKTIWRATMDEPRSILNGPDRVFLTHEPPKDVREVIFDAFEEKPSCEVARKLQMLALTKYLPAGLLEEGEALILAALEVANNADANDAFFGELQADFDKMLELFRARMAQGN